MPRKKRPVNPGDVVHTIFRTYNHEFLFARPEDHQIFIHSLVRQKNRYQNLLFAWTGMSNHHHVMQSAPINWHQETAFARRQNALGKPIQIGQMNRDTLAYFTKKFNWKNKRVGGLVQDRSKALPIGWNIQQLIVLIYIHINPLRAKIVKKLEDYPYSNYRQYAYGEDSESLGSLFDIHPVINRLGKTKSERQDYYRQIIHESAKDWALWRTKTMSGNFRGGPSVDAREEDQFWEYTLNWFERFRLKLE